MQELLGRAEQRSARAESAMAALPATLEESHEREQHEEDLIQSTINKITEANLARVNEPPPQPKTTNIGEQWGSPAMFLALFGSMLTREPLTNALNAGAAVMKGYQQRDFDAANAAYKKWKDNNDFALQMSKIQVDSLRQAMERIEKTSGEARQEAIREAQLLTGPGMINDPVSRMLLQAGNIPLLNDRIKLLEEQTKKLQTGGEGGEYMHDVMQATGERDAAQKALAEAQKKATADPKDQEAVTAAVTAQRTLAESQTKLADATEKFNQFKTMATSLHDTKGTKSASKNIIVTDGKGNEIFRGAAHETADGWVNDADGKPISVPEGGRIELAGSSSGGASRVGGQVLRQEIAGREVLSDLQNAISMPVGETTGVFGQYQAGTSLMDAVKGDVVRKLTTQDAQLMQASFASLERELSILMSPVYGGNWAAQQLSPLIPKEGDTVGTTLFKMARLAQSADNALEALNKSPILSGEQKDYAAALRKQITEAVPWSSAEAMAFARGESAGDQSFSSFMKENAGPSSTSGTNAPRSGDVNERPVPAGLKDHADGDGFRDPKRPGGLWVKHGDKLIWTPGAVPVQ